MGNDLIKLGAIDARSVALFESALSKCDPSHPIVIDIHSEGGSVFEGFKIGEMLSEWAGKKIARINVTAFSMASYIAALCDEVEIKSVGWLMVHNPYSMTEGDDDDHKRNAELLGGMKSSMVAAYSKKTGMGEAEVLALMKAETFLNAEQCVELGFADRIIGSEKPMAKSEAFAKFFNPVVRTLDMSTTDTQPKAATPQEIRSAFPKAKAEFVLSCIERQIPMAQVASEAARAMEEENTSMASQIAAMQDELAKMKALLEEKDQSLVVKEEELAKAKAKKVGISPLAQSSGSNPAGSAKSRWMAAVSDKVASGMARSKAITQVDVEQPELRQEMLSEVNAGRGE